MAVYSLDRLIPKFQRARSRRDNWKTEWDKLYELAFPGRESWYSTAPGENRSTSIFDSTLMDATNEFASRMAFGLTPNFAEWFRLEPGPATRKMSDPEGVNEIQRALDEVTSYVYSVISASNFQSANHEVMLDLALGFSCMEITDDLDPARIVRFSTLPQTQVFLETGPGGVVDASYRCQKLEPDEIPVVYPQAELPRGIEPDDDHKIAVVDCVYRDWDELKTETWHRAVWIVSEQDSNSEIWGTTYSGKGANPRLTPRWMTTSFEAYGRGPAYMALPDARTANLAQQLILENAEMAIAGMWQGDDDGVINFNSITLRPGMIFPRAPDSRGIEPLQSPARFDIAELTLNDLRSNIRRIMFAMDFGPEGAKTPRSATEISERASNQAGRISSPFARLMNEYIEPLVDRVCYLLKQRRLIEIPRINGREIQIISRSPLARAQRLEEIYNLQQFFGILQGIYGPAAPAFLKEGPTRDFLASRLEIPADILTTDEERTQMMQQMMAAMQPQEPPPQQ